MPSTTPQLSKQTLRQDLAGADREGGTTSGSGSSTTAVDSAKSTQQPDFYIGKYLALTSGTYTGQWRRITDFTSSTGTFTVAPAYGGTVASAVTYEVYSVRPDLYTLAVNMAIPKVYPAVHRAELDYVLVEDSRRRAYGVPAGILDAWGMSVEAEGSMKIKDRFDRATSTSSIGGDWTAATGTWGIASGERGYSVTDANADLITQDPDVSDGMIQCVVRGTLASGATYRSPALCFRIFEDYTGAIDTTNYLLVRLLNGSVDLRKVDASSESSLTTGSLTTSDGVDYVVRILFEGPLIRVWVDDNELITYNLVGLNLKYVDGVRVGVRWDKGGAPATAARIDDYRCHEVVPYVPLHDWRQTPDKQAVMFGVAGLRSGLFTDRYIRFEGTAPLTLLTSDSTWGTLDSDTTAKLEITTTDPALQYLIEAAMVELSDLCTDPNANQVLESIGIWAQRKAEHQRAAEVLRARNGMRLPSHVLGFAD